MNTPAQKASCSRGLAPSRLGCGGAAATCIDGQGAGMGVSTIGRFTAVWP